MINGLYFPINQLDHCYLYYVRDGDLNYDPNGVLKEGFIYKEKDHLLFANQDFICLDGEKVVKQSKLWHHEKQVLTSQKLKDMLIITEKKSLKLEKYLYLETKHNKDDFHIVRLKENYIETSKCSRLTRILIPNTINMIGSINFAGEFNFFGLQNLVKDDCFIFFIIDEPCHTVYGFVYDCKSSKLFQSITIKTLFYKTNHIKIHDTTLLLGLTSPSGLVYVNRSQPFPCNFNINFEPHIFQVLENLLLKDLICIVYEYFESFWSGFDEPLILNLVSK